MALAAVGGGLALLAIALRRRQLPPATDENVEWLARGILTEAHDPLSREGVGIGYVMVNRAMKAITHKSIRRVLSDPARRPGCDWFGCRQGAPVADGYCYTSSDPRPECDGKRTRGGKPVTSHPKWAAALGQARAILGGTIPNPIGERRFFVHPWGMPRCSSPGVTGADGCGRTQLCQDWGEITRGGESIGPRCINRDHRTVAQGGLRTDPQLRVGPAVFAGGQGFGGPLFWALLLPFVPP